MNRLPELLAEVERNRDPDSRDACRWFHGRGQCFTGLEQIAVDYFGDLILVTTFQAEQDEWLAALADALGSLPGLADVPVALQRRDLPGAPITALRGEPPLQLVVEEAGIRYLCQFQQRQNIGFFLDMAEARRWLAQRSAGKRVLNLFAFTCAFSVVARQHGASRVVNIDMSRGALKRGQGNHQLNGLSGGASFLPHNIFRSFSRLRREGPHDLLIVDPPSRQPGSFVIEADYPRLLRQLPSLCAPGADLLLCNNSPHYDTGYMQDLVNEQAPGLRFVTRLPNPPAFKDRDPEASLKVMHYVWEGGVGEGEPPASGGGEDNR